MTRTPGRRLPLWPLAGAMAGAVACSSAPAPQPSRASSAEAFILEVIARSGTHQDEPALLRMVPGGFTRDEARSNWFEGRMTAAPFELADGTRVHSLVVRTRSEIPVAAEAKLATSRCLRHGQMARVAGAQRSHGHAPSAAHGDGRDSYAFVRSGIFVIEIRGRDGCVTDITEVMQ